MSAPTSLRLALLAQGLSLSKTEPRLPSPDLRPPTSDLRPKGAQQTKNEKSPFRANATTFLNHNPPCGAAPRSGLRCERGWLGTEKRTGKNQESSGWKRHQYQRERAVQMRC